MKTTSIIITLLLLLELNACHRHEYLPDQQKRTGIFMQCLERIPDGPRQTQYNDWVEVVDACESAAYYQSKTRVCHHPNDSIPKNYNP